MIEFLLALSLAGNVVLVWYARKLLLKYAYDTEIRQAFTRMIADYTESLQAIYKLEEFYGEETLKKAIAQTRFVQEACEEFQTYLETQGQETGEEDLEEGDEEEDREEATAQDRKKEVIRLREGESVSQDAANYKRVITDQTF